MRCISRLLLLRQLCRNVLGELLPLTNRYQAGQLLAPKVGQNPMSWSGTQMPQTENTEKGNVGDGAAGVGSCALNGPVSAGEAAQEKYRKTVP